MLLLLWPDAGSVECAYRGARIEGRVQQIDDAARKLAEAGPAKPALFSQLDEGATQPAPTAGISQNARDPVECQRQFQLQITEIHKFQLLVKLHQC